MILFILIAILFLAMQTLALRKIAVTNLRENMLTTGIFTGLIAVCFWVWTLATNGTISGPTVLWGFLSAIAFSSTIICYHYAMKTGPLSYTTFMFSASMIIPALVGIIFWKEAVKLSTAAGLFLFLISFYFISVAGNKSAKKPDKKWLLFCFLSWFLNGCGSVIFKVQQTIMNGTEYSSMMTVSFSFSCVLCLAFYIILRITAKTSTAIQRDVTLIKTSIVPILLVALGSGGGNVLIIYLSSRMPSAYLFPFVLGSLIIVVTLYSRILLKEIINKQGVIGILLGLFAIIMINL